MDLRESIVWEENGWMREKDIMDWGEDSLRREWSKEKISCVVDGFEERMVSGENGLGKEWVDDRMGWGEN